MSRKGNCWGNAVSERFFASLKKELVHQTRYLTREEALAMVEDENRPRYPNIKWYLDALGVDFKEVIAVVNRIPGMY